MKKQRKRTHNLRRIKASHSYSIREICNLLGVHKNTVREWTRRGLSRIDAHRPYMFHGTTLKEYLHGTQSARKQKCGPEQFYCFRCRQPRRAWQGVIDITIRTAKIITLSGLCEQCNCPVNRNASAKDLPDIARIFIIQTVHNKHRINTAALTQWIGGGTTSPAGSKP